MPGVNPPNNEAFQRIIGDLQRQVRALATQQQLSFTDNLGRVFMTTGLLPGSNPPQYGLLMLNPANGQPVAFFGLTYVPDGSGRSQFSTLLWRDDGSGAFALSDLGTIPGHAHQQAWQFYDRSNTTILSDDTVSGTGLARPYLSGAFVDITPPTATTTSTTYQAMQWADFYVQHPKVTASVLAQTPVGVTANVRLSIAGGAVITPDLAIPANSFQQFTIPATAWPTGTSMFNRVTVQIDMQVTSGTGTVGVRGLGLWGVQS